MRICPSTTMVPPAVCARVVSSPMSSMLAARPVATRMQSAAISAASPPSGPTVRRIPVVRDDERGRVEAGVGDDRDPSSRETPFQLARDLGVLQRHDRGEVLEQRDRHAKVVEGGGEFAPDRAGSHDRRCSFGSSVSRSTSSEVRIRTPSGTIPGSDLTREPVARMTSVASSRRSPPSPGAPSAPWSWTRTRPAPSSLPRPATHSTLFLPTRLFNPVHMRRTTWSLLAATAA